MGSSELPRFSLVHVIGFPGGDSFSYIQDLPICPQSVRNYTAWGKDIKLMAPVDINSEQLMELLIYILRSPEKIYSRYIYILDAVRELISDVLYY